MAGKGKSGPAVGSVYNTKAKQSQTKAKNDRLLWSKFKVKEVQDVDEGPHAYASSSSSAVSKGTQCDDKAVYSIATQTWERTAPLAQSVWFELDMAGKFEFVALQDTFITSIIDILKVKIKNPSTVLPPMTGLFVFPPDPITLAMDCRSFHFSAFFLKPVFVWVPEILFPLYFKDAGLTSKGGVPMAPCPTCRSSKEVESNGWNSQHRRGVLDDGYCHIISRRYKCKACEKRKETGQSGSYTFNLYDNNVLPLLPDAIQSMFPFIVTHRNAIDEKILMAMADDLINGKGIKGSRESVHQRHLLEYSRRFKSYLSAIAIYRRNKPLLEYLPEKEQFLQFLSNPPLFGEFKSENYQGFCPSEHYFQTVWLEYFYNRNIIKDGKDKFLTWEDLFHRDYQTISGEILKGDASHKIAKLVLVRDKNSSSKPVYGIYTICNQDGQIVFQKAMYSASLQELKEDLKRLILERYISRGFEAPKIFFTDECCEDRQLISSIFTELEDDGVPIGVLSVSGEKERVDESTLPYFESEHILDECLTETTLSAWISQLKLDCQDKGEYVISLDIEWDPHVIQPDCPPCLIQLSYGHGNSVAAFQLTKRKIVGGKLQTIRKMPECLSNLLLDPKYVFVGNNINGDVTRLNNHFPNEDGESYCAKTMDLSTLARSAGCEIPGRLSLEKLSVSFLGLRIKKDPRIRLSAWSKPQLTKEQVRYACIDAIVSIKIYNEIISSMSPLLKQAPTSESAVVGRSVWLLAPKENTPVAFGIVQAQPSEKWSNTQLAFKTKNCERVVVKVDKVLRGNYICPFVQEKGAEKLLLKDCDGLNILWDLRRTRPGNFADWQSLQETIPKFKSGSCDLYISPELAGDDILATSGGLFDLEGDDEESVDIEEADECPDLGEDSEDRSLKRMKVAEPLKTHVNLDPFHAIQRISKTLKKTHGAFNAFMSRLRDVFFEVNQSDLSAICETLIDQGMTQEQVEDMKSKNWGFFLNHCRRRVPPKDILEKRFVTLITMYKGVCDAKTGEPLFRPSSMNAVKNLLRHIRDNCISDPPDIDLYLASHLNEQGLVVYKCFRGTNANEGYHKHLKNLLSSYTLSPQMVHSIALSFKYRWNLNASMKMNGSPKSLRGFYRLDILEKLNSLNCLIYGEPLYACYKSCLSLDDTLERAGFRSSKVEKSAEDFLIEIPMIHTSAREGLKSLLGIRDHCTPVRTKEEVEKFKNEWTKYANQSKSQNVHSVIDYAKWAIEWNRYIDKKRPENVYPKHQGHLQGFMKLHLHQLNSFNTLEPIHSDDKRMKVAMRIPQDFGPPRAIPSSSSILSSVTPKSPTTPSIVTINANKEDTTGRNPLVIKLKIPSVLNSDSLGHVESSSKVAVSTNLDKTVRSKPRCKECGHCLYGNSHKLKQSCPIALDLRLEKCTCDDFNTKRKKPMGSSHYCENSKCLLECCMQP